MRAPTVSEEHGKAQCSWPSCHTQSRTMDESRTTSVAWVTIHPLSQPWVTIGAGRRSATIESSVNHSLPSPPPYVAYGRHTRLPGACVCAQLLSRVWLCLPSSSVHGISHGKNTRVGCHSLLQGIFLMDLQRFLHWQAGSLPPSHLGSPNRNVLDLYPWRPKDPSFPNPLSKIHGPPLVSSQKLSRFFF